MLPKPNKDQMQMQKTQKKLALDFLSFRHHLELGAEEYENKDRIKSDVDTLVAGYKSWAYHPEAELIRDFGGGERPQYVCNTCGKSYQWKQGLNTHKRLHCGKEPRFQCPHCPKKCYQRGNLESHIRNVHSGIVQNNGISMLSGSGMQIIKRGPLATTSFSSSI